MKKAIRYCGILLLLGGCATSPTASDDSHFIFKPEVSEEQELIAEGEFSRILQCSNLENTLKHKVEVISHPSWFMCGNIKANGCTNYPNNIEVNATYWRPAIGHELIHWLMIDQNLGPDYNHKSPLWTACGV